jgi:hypothetical protein
VRSQLYDYNVVCHPVPLMVMAQLLSKEITTPHKDPLQSLKVLESVHPFDQHQVVVHRSVETFLSDSQSKLVHNGWMLDQP